MKKYFIIATLLLAAAATGCKREDPKDDTTKTPVSFVIEETVTRTVTNGNMTTFVTGDKVGITSTGLATEMENAEFTVTDNGALAGGLFYYDGKKSAVFYAHYPYSADYNAGNVTMTVSSDQSTAEKYNANDFMTAVATGDPVTGGTVTLRFTHRLALVKVVWNGSLTATAASLNGVASEAVWNQADNTISTDGQDIDINMWKTSKNSQEYWALIPAQKVPAGSELVTVTDETKSYKYVTASDINFNANTIKKITLTVKADGSVEAVISELDIENWDDDTIDGGGSVEEVVVPPVELISAAEGKNITLVPNSKGNAAAGAWNVAVESGNVIETTQNGELHFNVAAGSWWNNAVYYRPTEEKAAQIKPTLYKLTFEAKADAALKGFMVQVMKGDETANTYFGITNSDPTGKADVTYNRMYYPSFKDNQAGLYVKMTYWVNFAQIIDAGGTTITEAKAGDFSKVLLTLSINTGNSDANAYGVDFHFRNFEFVEVK